MASRAKIDERERLQLFQKNMRGRLKHWKEEEHRADKATAELAVSAHDRVVGIVQILYQSSFAEFKPFGSHSSECPVEAVAEVRGLCVPRDRTGSLLH